MHHTQRRHDGSSSLSSQKMIIFYFLFNFEDAMALSLHVSLVLASLLNPTY